MEPHVPSAPWSTARRTLLAVALTSALAIAGCGSAGASASPVASGATSAPVATDAPASAAAASGEPVASDTSACGGKVAATIKEHVANPAVATVEILGGCHMAFILTTLAPTDVKTALAICEKAAEVAYTDGVSSIAVVASDTKEMAIGLESTSCIGEP